MTEKDILYDYHNYGCNIASREIFLHNHYGSNDEENPGVEYKMSNTFIKNLRALDAKSSDQVTIHSEGNGAPSYLNSISELEPPPKSSYSPFRSTAPTSGQLLREKRMHTP